MENILPSLGSEKHLFPVWAIKSAAEVDAVCASMKKTSEAFYAELLPVLMQTVERARATMQQAGERAKTPNLGDDFLVIANDSFELKAEQLMGCDTGFCNMDVEEQLLGLVAWCNANGWKGAMRMYEDPERISRIRTLLGIQS